MRCHVQGARGRQQPSCRGCDFLHTAADGLIDEFTGDGPPALGDARGFAEAMQAQVLAIQRELGTEALA